jgi:hypothetical protein
VYYTTELTFFKPFSIWQLSMRTTGHLWMFPMTLMFVYDMVDTIDLNLAAIISPSPDGVEFALQ